MESSRNPLGLKMLDHISLVCSSVEKSREFYHGVLGFVPIRRPGSLEFEGAWLSNFGIGISIHLLQSENPENMPKITKINPKDNHISFQCESMEAVEEKLKEMKIEFVKARIEEGGLVFDQFFFHDPDGIMIEICNCDNIPVIPLIGSDSARPFSGINCNLHKPNQVQQAHQAQQAAEINQ